MMKKRLIQIFLCLVMLLPSLNASAINRVVITVGSHCITQLDVENRLKFISLMSGIQVSNENRKQLMQESAKMLLQEQLQIQEMQNMGLSIEEDVINNQLADMSHRINILPENLDCFFQERGIPMDTVRQFLTAQYYWPQYIRFKYPTTAEISDERVELIYKKQLEQKTKPRYLIAEIFLPVNAPSEEKAVNQQINMINEELRKGGQFPLLAQQFSQSPSARQGGNMGWVNLELLPEAARKPLLLLNPGQISTPLRLEEGYVIYALIDRRLPGESSVKDTVFSVRQMIMNLDYLQEGAIVDQLKKCKTCKDLESTLAQYPFIQMEKSDHVVVQQMNPQLADIITKLQDNTLSDPIRYPQGNMYLWVCNRKVMDGVMPKDEIRHRLILENLTQKSRSLLNQLSRTILVESHDPLYSVN